MQYNGSKLSFSTRVPSQYELSNFEHIHMTNDIPWDPSEVTFGQLQSPQRINQVRTGTEFLSPDELSTNTRDVFAYDDPTSDEAIMHNINPSLIELKKDTSVN